MYGLKADARVVGSFAALRFIPYDAEVLAARNRPLESTWSCPSR